jgi:hypothetical protein
MILREATIKYKGYDPNLLSKGSNKRVCCSCAACGRIRYMSYSKYVKYMPLCRSCSKMGNKNPQYGLPKSDETKLKLSNAFKGENNPNYGKICSEKTKQKIKNNHARLSGELNPNWKGGSKESRKRTYAKKKNFKYIPLNNPFPGCEGHHINKELVIHIPKELHRHLYHNVFNNQNMYEINMLTLQYLKGEF